MTEVIISELLCRRVDLSQYVDKNFNEDLKKFLISDIMLLKHHGAFDGVTGSCHQSTKVSKS